MDFVAVMLFTQQVFPLQYFFLLLTWDSHYFKSNLSLLMYVMYCLPKKMHKFFYTWRINFPWCVYSCIYPILYRVLLPKKCCQKWGGWEKIYKVGWPYRVVHSWQRVPNPLFYEVHPISPHCSFYFLVIAPHLMCYSA